MDFIPTGGGKTYMKAFECIEWLTNPKERDFERIIYTSPLKILGRQFEEELIKLASKKKYDIKILVMKSDSDSILENKDHVKEVISYSRDRYVEMRNGTELEIAKIPKKSSKKLSDEKRVKLYEMKNKSAILKFYIDDLNELEVIFDNVKGNLKRLSDDDFKQFCKVLKNRTRYILDMNKSSKKSEDIYIKDLSCISKVFTSYQIEFKPFDVVILTHQKLTNYISPSFKPLYSNLMSNSSNIKSLVENSILIIDEFESIKSVVSEKIIKTARKDAIKKVADDVNTISRLDENQILTLVDIKLKNLTMSQTEKLKNLLDTIEQAKKLDEECHFNLEILADSQLINKKFHQAFNLRSELLSYHASNFEKNKFIESYTGLIFKKVSGRTLVKVKGTKDPTIFDEDEGFVYFDDAMKRSKKVINTFVSEFVNFIVSIRGFYDSAKIIKKTVSPIHNKPFGERIIKHYNSRTEHIKIPDNIFMDLIGLKGEMSNMSVTTTKLVDQRVLNTSIFSFKGSPEEYLFFLMCLTKELHLLSATGGIEHLNNFSFDKISEISGIISENWDKTLSETFKSYKEKGLLGRINKEKVSNLGQKIKNISELIPRLFEEDAFDKSMELFNKRIAQNSYEKYFNIEVASHESNIEPGEVQERINKKALNIIFENNTRTEYERDRFKKICYSINRFAEEDHYVGIFFLNYHLRNDKHRWLSFINSIFYDKNIEFLILDKDNVFDVNKIIESTMYSKSKRIILFSTYPTLAVGTNVRYKKDSLNSFYKSFNEKEHVVKVKKYDSNLVDIDFAYYEHQTMVIDCDNIEELREELVDPGIDEDKTLPGVKNSYIVKNMTTFGLINSENSKDVQRVMANSFAVNKMASLASLYGKELYYNITLKVFLQAVGRMSRSTYKLKNSRIILDEKLVMQLNNGKIPSTYPLSPEQKKILEEISSYTPAYVGHPEHVVLVDNLHKGRRGDINAQAEYQLNRISLANNLISTKSYFLERNVHTASHLERKDDNKNAYSRLLDAILWPEFEKINKLKDFSKILKDKGINIKKGDFFLPLSMDKEAPKVVCGFLGEILFEFALSLEGIKKGFFTTVDEFENFDYIFGETAIDVKTYSNKNLLRDSKDLKTHDRKILGTRARRLMYLPVFPSLDPKFKIKPSKYVLTPLLEMNKAGQYEFNYDFLNELKKLEPNYFKDKSSFQGYKDENDDQLDLF